jgi:cytochrome c oxidase subunit III
MAHAKNHDYHILPPSIWPLMASVGSFTMLFGGVLGMHWQDPTPEATTFMEGLWGYKFAVIGLLLVLYVMYGWWAEVVHEAQTGDHTPVVSIGLRYGFIMFIMSEVMFFAAWFWTFFKHRMYPMGPASPAVDGVWPPAGIETFDPWHLPLINTLILLCSGAAATWAHHALVHDNNRKDLVNGLWLAIGLGLMFTGFTSSLARSFWLCVWRVRGQGTLRRTSTSGLRRRHGTGILSMWSGCSCLRRSMSGVGAKHWPI